MKNLMFILLSTLLIFSCAKKDLKIFKSSNSETVQAVQNQNQVAINFPCSFIVKQISRSGHDTINIDFGQITIINKTASDTIVQSIFSSVTPNSPYIFTLSNKNKYSMSLFLNVYTPFFPVLDFEINSQGAIQANILPLNVGDDGFLNVQLTNGNLHTIYWSRP